MILRESKKAKEEWLNDKCSSVTNCFSKGMGDKAYKIIKRFFSEHKNREEFEIALKELKSNKAPGIDKLNGELLKAQDGYGKDILFRIIGKTYENGIIPKDFEKYIIIPIPKKNKSEKLSGEEDTLKEVRKENIEAVKIRGILVQMLRFADDIAEVRESEEDITNMNDKMLWTEKIKNTENTLRLKRKAWIGHILRNSLWLTTIIEGKIIEENPGRGRPRTPFIKQTLNISSGLHEKLPLKKGSEVEKVWEPLI
ncbi:craniofacial development protein 2-like [Aphis craccivora]|uniref:Craniofacial development protein 2-like n=1 Tax=Aphis craccivora TaxID=307492 RepID=A0A6G0YSQ7_APHCR|nr:craniofacial development protein 2-like [Aphis craccivora]